MLLSRKRRKFDKTGERIAGEIYSEFGIKVAATTNVSPSALSDLQEALGVIYRYYGLSERFGRKSGIEILLEKAVYENSSFFFRGNEINGMYEYGTNTIHLPVGHPDALVHELIHAIDYSFRNPAMNRDSTFIDDAGRNALTGFLRRRGVPENDIIDFENSYDRMSDNISMYLRMPSEIVARMGAYSFWNDNKEACEGNPFLKFSYAPYTELDRKTGSIKAIDQFPFHSIDAVRLFVHHASRDIAREKPDRWHPPFSEDFASEHDSEWYRKAWYRLDDARYSVNDAERIIRENSNAIRSSPHMPDDDRKWHEDAIRRARLQLPSATENLESTIALLSRDVMTDELQERVLNLERDDGIRLAISFLKECQGFSLLREKHPERAQKRQTEREQQEI